MKLALLKYGKTGRVSDTEVLRRISAMKAEAVTAG
jgi:hypothetical protein